MAGTPHTPTTFDPPVTGRAGGLRIRGVHPDMAASPDADPLTVRLLFLLRSNPGLVNFRADDLADLDTATKTLLLAQIDKALGLDKPVPAILPSDG
jgi:hypothetical protein